MKKYLIVKEGLGVKSITCEVSDREYAEVLAKRLNGISKAGGSAMKYDVYELIKD